MNLREQIEKEITDKVMTKLASERVELGLIDDLKKVYNKALSFQKNANKRAANMRSEKAALQGDVAEIFDSISLLDKDIEKVKSMAKDLGISTPKEVVAYEKFIKDSEQKANKYIKDFNL